MTEENKSKTGRPLGKAQPQLQKYPGILWKQRLAYLRMKAQAKYRDETFELAWEDYLAMWEGRWHLRGSISGCLTMSRKDWEQGWTKDNIEVISRLEHWDKQNRARLDSHGRRKPYKKKPKDVD